MCCSSFPRSPIFGLCPGSGTAESGRVGRLDRMAELLKELSERFERGSIDSPPVLVVTDGTILAGLVYGVVLVAESGRTHRAGHMRTRAVLENAGARILGVVLNKLDMQREGYYGYGYGNYYYIHVMESIRTVVRRRV